MIKALVTDYDTLLSLLDHFYTSYEVQWMYDNKPHGFDVIDLRRAVSASGSCTA